MKVLECNCCHSLFKSTNNHFTFYSKEENYNFCEECSMALWKFVRRGIRKAMQEDEGLDQIIRSMKPISPMTVKQFQ